MRRQLMVLAFLVALLVGCSNHAAGPTAGLSATVAPTVSPTPTPIHSGTPVSSVGPFETPTPTNLYEGMPDVESQILWDLEGRVQAQAGWPGSMTGHCDQPIDAVKVTEATCTITLDGVPAPFSVTTYDALRFVATQQLEVLSGTGVRAAFYRWVATKAPTQVSTAECDIDPKVRRQVVTGLEPFWCWYQGMDGSANVLQVSIVPDDPPQFVEQ